MSSLESEQDLLSDQKLVTKASAILKKIKSFQIVTEQPQEILNYSNKNTPQILLQDDEDLLQDEISQEQKEAFTAKFGKLTRELISGVSFGDRVFALRRTATVIGFTPCDLLILDVKADAEIEWLFKDYLNSIAWRRQMVFKLFSELSDYTTKFLDTLWYSFQVERKIKGQVLTHAKQKGEIIYLIESGQILLEQEYNGANLGVCVIGDGSLIGDELLLDNDTYLYTSTVQSLTTVVLTVTKQCLQMRIPENSLKLLKKRLSEKLETREKVMQQKKLEIESNLKKELKKSQYSNTLPILYKTEINDPYKIVEKRHLQVSTKKGEITQKKIEKFVNNIEKISNKIQQFSFNKPKSIDQLQLYINSEPESKWERVHNAFLSRYYAAKVCSPQQKTQLSLSTSRNQTKDHHSFINVSNLQKRNLKLIGKQTNFDLCLKKSLLDENAYSQKLALPKIVNQVLFNNVSNQQNDLKHYKKMNEYTCLQSNKEKLREFLQISLKHKKKRKFAATDYQLLAQKIDDWQKEKKGEK